MTSAYERFRQTRFFGSLDGLRAISIAGVIWFHSWWGTPYYPRLKSIPVLRLGEYGVQVFFVISGFLITTLLLREQDRFGKISIRDFYLRRALRIWPLYYATIALYVVLIVGFQKGAREATFMHYLPYFLTYTYTWFISPLWPTGPFHLAWTLATEEQFYAFWPLVLRFLRGAWSSVVIIALILLRVAAGNGWTNVFLRSGSLPDRIVLSASIPICFGVLLAQAAHSETCFRWIYVLLGQKWSAPAAAVALAICLYPKNPPWLAAFSVTAVLVGSCVIREDNGLSRVLQFRPLAYMGVLSYGMYLLNSVSVHAAQLSLGWVGITNPVPVCLLSLALALAAAFFSYRYFESRFLALKTRFSRLRPDPAASAPDAIATSQPGVALHP
jgi:peptidoglycan/LPS O-acetylase OafA/YrhL